MAYDQAIIAAIRREAARVSDPNKRNRYLRAALQTGIVESGLRNLNYGDADSKGWRQERASLYKNPTNISASVRRFFQEAAQHDRGQPSWELAADVQRPAAQYRGRYKDVAGEAVKLLGGGDGGGGGGGGGGKTTTTTSDPTAVVAQALLPQTLPERPQVQVTAPRAPEFAAKLATATAPGGAALAPPSAPIQPRPTVGAALEAMQRLAPQTSTTVVPGETTTTTTSGGGGGNRRTGSLAPGGSYSGTTAPVVALAKLAHSYGLQTTSSKRPTVNTASGNVSDHYAGNKGANARDLSGSVADMDRAAVALARRLGISGYKKGQPLEKSITRGGLRYQILYRTNTGGNHFNHIHVGVKRV